MQLALRSLLASLLLPLAQAQVPVPADFVVSSGETVVYSTVDGPLFADRLIVEEGGTLRAAGPDPFRVRARSMVVNGLIDLSGSAGRSVFTQNTANLPEPGAAAGPGGGFGGNASENTTGGTAAGGTARGPRTLDGGGGGESGFHFSSVSN